MIAQTTHIETPPEWESLNDYDSHRPLLYLALKNNTKEVLEYGMGFGSTGLIGKYCKENKVSCLSIENDSEWREKVKEGIEREHQMVTIMFTNSAVGFAGRWVDESIEHHANRLRKTGIVFIDHKPGEDRKEVIKEWADYADIILAHDTEETANYVYGMKDVLSSFKYRLDYQPLGKPRTTAVSNHVNVSKWI